MSGGLDINPDWEYLGEGSPEERACFANLEISHGHISLTEGHDTFANRTRSAPYLSAYHLAEWLAWNWWRLRWEPRSPAPDWALSHRMSTIGSGYVWPNITIFSDGERTALLAEPTLEASQTSFRYISNYNLVIPSRQFEATVDQFIAQIRQQLRDEGVAETNLDRIWNDVCCERADQSLILHRKLEALLGSDPDEVNTSDLQKLLEDIKSIGSSAIAEIAADHPRGGELMSFATLQSIAKKDGFDGSPEDAVQLAATFNPRRRGEVPAWRIGAEAAKLLREQEALGDNPISDVTLAKLSGVQLRALTDSHHGPNFSFSLDSDKNASKIVLRSKWQAGRRFDLARLLGDRILNTIETQRAKLFPATRSFTFRQKVQRSFAAEFLSPFDRVNEMLAGDYSAENQQDVAEYFTVSPLTIRTLLVNHGRVERDGDFEMAVA